MFFAFWLAGDNPNKYFEAVLGLTISASLVSLLGIFPAIIKLRYSHAHVRRPFRIPGGNAGAWACGILTTFWCALATLALVWPGFGIGWFGTSGNPDDALVDLSFSGQRLQYELTQLLPLLFFVGVGVVFYLVGGRTRRDMVDVPVAAESRSIELTSSAEASATATP
jgi:amino acid transporter